MNLVFSTRLPRIGLAALALVGVAFAAPRLASATTDSNVTIAVPTIELTAAQGTAGASGYFDVTITDTAAESLAQVQGTINLTGPGIVANAPSGNAVQIVGGDYGQLTNAQNADSNNAGFGLAVADGIGDAAGASPNLLSPYVFGNVYASTNSNDVQTGAGVSTDSTNAQNSDGGFSGNTTLTAGTTYSIEQVYWSVAPGTGPGTYSLTLVTDAPFQSNVAGGDPNADYVNLVNANNTTSYEQTLFTNGAIVINAPVVPEPASIVLMVLGAVGLVGFGLRRARRA
jgi:hypothetical protein